MEKSDRFVPFKPLVFNREEQQQLADDFYARMQFRRSIRHFSTEMVPRSVITAILRTAGTAPSGANKQPWTFCAVSDQEIKKQIRAAAEAEEYESYHGRMNQTWLNDLEPLGTNWEKPFLEEAPWLIVVFRQTSGPAREQHYYVQESVGIATGILITAIHNAGLVTLTHTPSPMDFLAKVLKRPSNEKPFLLLPVGYPAAGARVPDIRRKKPEDFIVYY